MAKRSKVEEKTPRLETNEPHENLPDETAKNKMKSKRRDFLIFILERTVTNIYSWAGLND